MAYPRLTDEELASAVAALPFRVGDVISVDGKQIDEVREIRRFYGSQGSWDRTGRERITVVTARNAVRPSRCALVKRKFPQLAALAMRYRIETLFRQP